MTFRSRLLIAFAVATIIPLALLALGVRSQITSRILAQHRQRVRTVSLVAGQDFERLVDGVDRVDVEPSGGDRLDHVVP